MPTFLNFSERDLRPGVCSHALIRHGQGGWDLAWSHPYWWLISSVVFAFSCCCVLFTSPKTKRDSEIITPYVVYYNNWLRREWRSRKVWASLGYVVGHMKACPKVTRKTILNFISDLLRKTKSTVFQSKFSANTQNSKRCK